MIGLVVLKGSRKQQMEAKNRQPAMKKNRVMLLTTPWQLMHTYRWHVHTVCPITVTWQSTDKFLLERRRAKNVAGLATELDIPYFPSLLRYFLHSQLDPTDTRLPEEIPLEECPFYNGKLRVYNSACSTFFAPSDLSGVHGMRREHIRSCPMWRKEGPRLDCVFIVTNPQTEGMRGLDVACILCFFSFDYLGTRYPCAVVHWFDRIGDSPDESTGMWIVRPGYQARNIRNIAVVHIDTIYRAAHLIPVYSTHRIDSEDFSPHRSYDMFQSFYMNKFADHHAFEIAF